MLLERRRSPRYLCSHIVEISHGGRTAAGLLEDLSAEGAAVAVEAAVEASDLVEFRATGLRGRARVRYCRRRENDFVIGLEFANGCRWQPLEWQPDHLFLPPKVDP